MLSTPLTYNGVVILDANGKTVAEASTPEMARILVAFVNAAAAQ